MPLFRFRKLIRYYAFRRGDLKISVTFRGPIRSFVESSHLCFHATSAADLVRQIQDQNPTLFHAMFLPSGELNPFVKIFRKSTEVELPNLFVGDNADSESITVMSIMSGG